MSCCRELIWVSWSTICEGSMGLSGSWACSWAVSKVMNELGSSSFEPEDALVVEEGNCVPGPGVGWSTPDGLLVNVVPEAIVSLLGAARSGPHAESSVRIKNDARFRAVAEERVL